MKTSDSLKKHIKRWADNVGPEKASIALVAAGLGLSTAQKLIAGTYRSKVKRIAKKLSTVLEKEGRPL